MRMASPLGDVVFMSEESERAQMCKIVAIN